MKKLRYDALPGVHKSPNIQSNPDLYEIENIAFDPQGLIEAAMQQIAPWKDAVVLDLGTTRPDGRPHAAGVGALWLDGEIYFTSGPGTRKSRNLAANPACTIAASLETIDIVMEGEAHRVTDGATLEQVAAACRESGWPVQVEGDAFTAPYSAPSAGPPPWYLYRFDFHTVIGNATTEPHGATRWRFED